MPDRRVTFKMLDKEKRRRMTTCAVYFAILLLGILIGLIPYLLNYVKESRADREVLREFIKKNMTDYRAQFANLEANVKKFIAGHKPSSMAITSKITKTILHKKGLLSTLFNTPSCLPQSSVIGNGKIELVCNGIMNVVSVKLNDAAALPKDVKRFNDFCKTNKTTDKNTNSCQVSMESVMGYILGSSEFTEIDYNCEETF